MKEGLYLGLGSIFINEIISFIRKREGRRVVEKKRKEKVSGREREKKREMAERER